jgi:hypothetical protein
VMYNPNGRAMMAEGQRSTFLKPLYARTRPTGDQQAHDEDDHHDRPLVHHPLSRPSPADSQTRSRQSIPVGCGSRRRAG